MNRRLRRKRVLFSDKYGWKDNICSELNRWRYLPCFKSFPEADLNEFDILIPQHSDDPEQCLQEFEQISAGS